MPISKITDLSLQVIVFLIGWITGFAALHQAYYAQMNYVFLCLNAQVFYWTTTFLECMKRQLIDFHLWTHRNFGFGTILCSFFFERVPSFSPRVVVRGHQASLHGVCRWAVLLPQQGGGRTNESFDDDFFCMAVTVDPGYRGLPLCRD